MECLDSSVKGPSKNDMHEIDASHFLREANFEEKS